MARILLSALSAPTGGGITYIRNIVPAFPLGPGDRLSVLSHEWHEGFAGRADIEWIRAPGWSRPPITRFLLGLLYFRFFWPRRHDFDVVYYAGGTFDVPLPARVRTVAAFRNMLAFDPAARRRYRPGWTRFRNWLLSFVQGWGFRRANLVIFISEHGRQVIDARVRKRRGGSLVVPHGVARTPRPLDSEMLRRLPDRFVLYLSTLAGYKAQLELVEAWACLRRRRPPVEKLVLAGPVYKPYARRVRAAIRRHGLEEEVLLIGEIGHDQVFDLAGRAALNLFLSSCENCPNILLELMSAGRPMLVSSRAPMPEFGGPDLEYVDPFDVPAVAAALGRLIGDSALRDRTAEAASARSAAFDWRRSAAMTSEAIRAVALDPAPAAGRAGESLGFSLTQ